MDRPTWTADQNGCSSEGVVYRGGYFRLFVPSLVSQNWLLLLLLLLLLRWCPNVQFPVPLIPVATARRRGRVGAEVSHLVGLRLHWWTYWRRDGSGGWRAGVDGVGRGGQWMPIHALSMYCSYFFTHTHCNHHDRVMPKTIHIPASLDKRNYEEVYMISDILDWRCYKEWTVGDHSYTHCQYITFVLLRISCNHHDLVDVDVSRSGCLCLINEQIDDDMNFADDRRRWCCDLWVVDVHSYMHCR